ncbi:MAG: tetratricopeptide repeat protein, partial [Limnothrix sp.]
SNPQSYLPCVAMSLNNLAVLHQELKKYKVALGEYEEALEKYRQLAASNPQSYLPGMAITLNNLANLHSDRRKYKVALGEYEEALEIYQKLAATNPQSYLPYVSSTAINLSIFYQKAVPDRQKSITLANEALTIIQPFLKISMFQQYAATAQQVLDDWEQKSTSFSFGRLGANITNILFW